eukprot:TRINITY_DN33913_c0_g1_i1.p1 TRINITY_DN33913_c0_g1~~TRINITY_DN33913_c0_g1_i1.p1  ORF type:complete len:781 (-),score=161.77 TRINITY_DN33913_c0_g1_i1:41-2383(-)
MDLRRSATSRLSSSRGADGTTGRDMVPSAPRSPESAKTAASGRKSRAQASADNGGSSPTKVAKFRSKALLVTALNRATNRRIARKGGFLADGADSSDEPSDVRTSRHGTAGSSDRSAASSRQATVRRSRRLPSDCAAWHRLSSEEEGSEDDFRKRPSATRLATQRKALTHKNTWVSKPSGVLTFADGVFLQKPIPSKPMEEQREEALDRIAESGLLTIAELPPLLPILTQHPAFQGRKLHAIAAGCQQVASLRCNAEGTIIWDRLGHHKYEPGSEPFSRMSSGEIYTSSNRQCSNETFDIAADKESVVLPSVCLVVQGTVRVVDEEEDCSDAVDAGALIEFGEDDSTTIGLVAASSPCIVLLIPLDRLEKVMESAGNARQAMHEVLKRKHNSQWNEDEMDLISDCLQSMSFFEDLDPQVVRKLVPKLEPQVLEAEDRLACESDAEGGLFYLRRGAAIEYARELADMAEEPQVKGFVRKTSSSMQEPPDTRKQFTPIRRFGEDSIINESFLFGWGRLSADLVVRCEKRCQVLFLSRAAFEQCFDAEGLARQRGLFVLRSAPPTKPGEAAVRADEQLDMLAKLVDPADPFFGNMPQAEVLQVMGAARLLSCPRGHIIFRQGEKGDKLYAIVSGRCGVHIREGYPGRSAADRQDLAEDDELNQDQALLETALRWKDENYRRKSSLSPPLLARDKVRPSRQGTNTELTPRRSGLAYSDALHLLSNVTNKKALYDDLGPMLKTLKQGISFGAISVLRLFLFVLCCVFVWAWSFLSVCACVCFLSL